MWENRVGYQGWKDPLEKEMEIHSRVHFWRIPQTEETDRLQSMGLQTARHDWATNIHIRHKIRSLGYSISVALRKLLQGSRRGRQATYKFATKTEGSLNIKDFCEVKKEKSEIKLRNLALYVWEDASLWAPWIHPFPMHFSSLGSNPISLFTLRGGRWLLLAFPQFLSHHCGVAAFARLEVWEPSFTVWGQKSLMAAIFLVYWNGRKYFHFIKLSVLSIQFYCEPKAEVKHNAYIQKYPWKPRAQIFIDLHNFFQGNNSYSFRVKISFKIAYFLQLQSK